MLILTYVIGVVNMLFDYCHKDSSYERNLISFYSQSILYFVIFDTSKPVIR